MKNLFFMLFVIVALCACTSTHEMSHGVQQQDTLVVDSVMTLSGNLIIGHEVRSFAPDGDSLVYWIIDRSGTLKALYDSAVGIDASPYTPVRAELRVIDKGKSNEGFAADYDGVYEVVEIVEIENVEKGIRS